MIRLMSDRALAERIAAAVKEHQEYEDRRTVYALRCQVEVIDFGDEVDPWMRWRWNIWQNETLRDHPIMLGNAPNPEDATRHAYGWISRQQQRYDLKRLPAVIPLEEDSPS